MGAPVLKVDFCLPESEYQKLGAFIRQEVEKAFTEKAESIRKQTVKLTRQEASEMLRISLPTLDKLRNEGTLKASTIGKRVLFDQTVIENYLNRER